MLNGVYCSVKCYLPSRVKFKVSKTLGDAKFEFKSLNYELRDQKLT